MAKTKKKNIKVRDLNPKKDAKGGGGKFNTQVAQQGQTSLTGQTGTQGNTNTSGNTALR